MLFKLKSFSLLAGALLVFATSSAALAAPECSSIFGTRDSNTVAAINAHAAIASDLYTGKIISMRRFKENDNRNLLFLVKIQARDPFTGEARYRDAFFKPSIYGDGGGYARAGMEYAAYELNRILKMDYVPPTAYRRRLDLSFGGMHLTQGALIFKVPDFKPMADLENHEFNTGTADYHEAVESDHRVLAVLLQNGDGHHWNLGQGRHWVDGAFRPVFIDWGASLRPGTDVSMDRYEVFGNSRPVTRIRAQTLQALRGLTLESMRPLIDGHFINITEAQFILSTRDGIVLYFDRLIETEGEDRILIRF